MIDHRESWLILALILGLTLTVCLIEYLAVNNMLYAESAFLEPILTKIYFHQEKFLIARILLLGLSVLGAISFPNFHTSYKSNFEKIILIAGAACLSFLSVKGYVGDVFYNLYLFPVILLSAMLANTFAFKTLLGNSQQQEIKNLNHTSDKFKKGISFRFKTNKGWLSIFNPMQGIFIDASAGFGKSESLIEPIIAQAIKNDYALCIYDFEGNPNEKDAPILGRTAYTALQNELEPKKSKFNNILRSVLAPRKVRSFKFINFVDMAKTCRCNPLDRKYVRTRLEAQELADTIMKNLEKDWINKTDFWAQNAISFLTAAIWMMNKNYPQFNTLPHVVSLLLNPYDVVLKFLSQDDEVRKLMMPIITAFEEKAGSQSAGAVSSTQLPISKLFTPEIFWVCSKNELDLDITNPENPIILCIGNAPHIKTSLSPVVSLILNVCMNQMNQLGKHPKSAIIIDELPTIYVNKMDSLPATARKKGVSTIVAIQDYNQLDRDYTTKNAKVIKGVLSNYFLGGTNNYDEAEKLSKMIGNVTVFDRNISRSGSGETVSDNSRQERIIRPESIINQPVGHFTGKIAQGEPAAFSCQLPRFKMDKLEIKPFAFKAKTGEEVFDRKILDKQVELNFKKIQEEIDQLLAPFNSEGKTTIPDYNKV